MIICTQQSRTLYNVKAMGKTDVKFFVFSMVLPLSLQNLDAKYTIVYTVAPKIKKKKNTCSKNGYE